MALNGRTEAGLLKSPTMTDEATAFITRSAHSGPRGRIRCGLSISPDGSRLATASPPINALLWRVAADFSASVPMRDMGEAIRLEVGFSASSREAVFSGDGWGIYSADEGASLDGVAPPPWVPTTGCWFGTARFSSSGRWLAVSGLGAQMEILARSDLHENTVLPITHCQSRGSFYRDDSLVAMSGPEVYLTSDWSLVWSAQIVPETPPPNLDAVQDFFRDAQFAPGGQALLDHHPSAAWPVLTQVQTPVWPSHEEVRRSQGWRARVPAREFGRAVRSLKRGTPG